MLSLEKCCYIALSEKTNHPDEFRLLVIHYIERQEQPMWEGKLFVGGSSVNDGYFARTSCATTINQLKVFDIIPSITE